MIARELLTRWLWRSKPRDIVTTLPVIFVQAKMRLERAIEVLRPFARSGKGSRRCKLEYADGLNSLSHDQSPAQGVDTCEEALSVLAGLGALDWSGLDAASAWADTADSQARELVALSRMDEAERVERQALKLAEGVVERRPTDLRARKDFVLHFGPAG